jgi:hypothetical protein
MSKGALLRCCGTLTLLFLISNKIISQGTESSSIRMMFYNVENFFDIYDDSLRDDNDFLPDGAMHWNYARYKSKLISIYKVITAAGEWSPPALIGFCEVEKRSVLEDLITDTYLSKYDYGIVHEESPDARGIDVCLIYRKDLLNLLDYKYILPDDQGTREARTRSVLYSRWLISNDTVHLFLNHWPSRRGGVLPGEATRWKISEMLNDKVDSLMKNTRRRARIIIAGDFNCSPEDETILNLLKHDRDSPGLINLSERYSLKGEGSYRYMGTWEMLDQVIVSDWLVNCDKGINTSPVLFRIFRPDFLLRKDSKYPGMSPFSTYLGYRYQGGYSDHLPVLLDLRLKRIIQKP